MSRKKDEARGDRPQGVLIAVDGMAGADIRKHANGLVRRLRSRKAGVGVSWWDASGLFFEMGLGKRKHRVASPRTLMLLYASDLLFRLRWEIRPALAAGQKVIAAPYLATAFAFGRANGLPAEWLTALFRFAPPPVASYLAQERKKSGRKRGQQAGFAEFSSEVLAAAVPSFDAVAMRQKMIGLLDRGERAAGKGRAARPGRGSRN